MRTFSVRKGKEAERWWTEAKRELLILPPSREMKCLLLDTVHNSPWYPILVLAKSCRSMNQEMKSELAEVPRWGPRAHRGHQLKSNRWLTTKKEWRKAKRGLLRSLDWIIQLRTSQLEWEGNYPKIKVSSNFLSLGETGLPLTNEKAGAHFVTRAWKRGQGAAAPWTTHIWMKAVLRIFREKTTPLPTKTMLNPAWWSRALRIWRAG